MTRFGRRERLRIFYRVAWVGIAPLVLMWAFTWLNLNPKEPTFFDHDYFARYQADGELAERGWDEVRVESRSPDRLLIQQPGQPLEYAVDGQGRFSDSSGFSLVWIYFPNPVTEWRRSKIEAAINSIRVQDAAGWIGPAGATYQLKFSKRLILWSRILDSQASFEVAVLDSRGREAATAIYDATIGLLFELRTHTGQGLGTLSLLKTNFLISRNRYWQGGLAVLFGLLVVLYQFTALRRKLAAEPKLFILEADLVLFGVLAIWTDAYYDIWFFHYLWTPGLLAIHLALAAYVFWRFGWWGILPLFEVFWSLAFSAAQDSLEPQFAYNPALILAWVGCLLFADFRRRLA